MRKIRVLVVDDAVVIRKIVGDVLSSDPEIEVVGTAANGRIALQRLTQLQPDLVTLDVEMPEMDGLDTLKALRKTHPRLPVIMFSTLTQRGATATIDALTFGASDYVTKPANVGSVVAAQQRVRDDLIPKIKALTSPQPQRDAAAPPARPEPARTPPGPTAVPASTRPDLVAIGVSTGGPNALAAIVPNLPKDFGVPIVIVQHMPPMFTKLLADRLDAQSAVRVAEAAGGEALVPGTVYLAPGGSHMIVRRRGHQLYTALTTDPPENSCRPAVDVLFRSVARECGPDALAVVLTGMGQDGLRGCEAIKQRGGVVLVQDEATSVIWGMPGFVARAGLADGVVPLSHVAREVVARVESPARTAVVPARAAR